MIIKNIVFETKLSIKDFFCLFLYITVYVIDSSFWMNGLNLINRFTQSFCIYATFKNRFVVYLDQSLIKLVQPRIILEM